MCTDTVAHSSYLTPPVRDDGPSCPLEGGVGAELVTVCKREYKFLVARGGGSAQPQDRDSQAGTGPSAVQQAAPLKCGSHWHASVRARKSATAMRWRTGGVAQDTMDTSSVHFDEQMDFENLAGLDLATLKRQLRSPIRGSPKRGSDSRSGTWP